LERPLVGRGHQRFELLLALGAAASPDAIDTDHRADGAPVARGPLADLFDQLAEDVAGAVDEEVVAVLGRELPGGRRVAGEHEGRPWASDRPRLADGIPDAVMLALEAELPLRPEASEDLQHLDRYPVA